MKCETVEVGPSETQVLCERRVGFFLYLIAFLMTLLRIQEDFFKQTTWVLVVSHDYRCTLDTIEEQMNHIDLSG